MMKSYIDVTDAAGAAFFSKPSTGPITMLNLLRYRDVADYSEFPELAPDNPISGKEAYALYMQHATPLIQKAGSKLIFKGTSSSFLIGPEKEHWDLVLLVKHESSAKFLEFARDPAYQKIIGYRTAALLDSRLLPIEQ